MRYNGNMEVCTLTLNPCLDRTLWVEDFGLPPTREEWQTGGKGVNVARVLAALGVEARAVCPLGGETGARFRELAKAEGVDVLPVDVPAPTRIIDTWAREKDFAQRVDYRAGEPLTEEDMDHLEEALFQALPGARVLAVCGSAPGAAAAGRVAGILRRAKKMGVATVLDSNGAALLQGVEGCPDLLKPNERELEALTGSADPASAWALIERGVGRVLVSLGERGCCLVGADAGGPAELLPLTLGARGRDVRPRAEGGNHQPRRLGRQLSGRIPVCRPARLAGRTGALACQRRGRGQRPNVPRRARGLEGNTAAHARHGQEELRRTRFGDF